MTFFSGITFVLYCFVIRLYALIEAAAFRSIVLRYAGAPIATRVFFFFFRFCLFVDIGFSFGTIIAVFSLSGEYVIYFPLPGCVFLPCDHRLDF